MATTDKRLDISELDFDDIKTNLKTFLRNQTELTDYDFEGSGLSNILDVLAYSLSFYECKSTCKRNVYLYSIIKVFSCVTC